MALVTEGFEVVLSVQDNGKGKSNLTYVCDPAIVTDFATAQAARAAAAAALANVIQGVIVGTRLTEVQFEDSIVYPVSNIEIENKASVTVQLDGLNKKGNLKIPTVSPAIFIGNSGVAADQVDVLDPFLVAYVDLFRNTTGQFYIATDQKVADTPNGNGIVVGKRISSKNNNG
ncbi:MAG: hypothetical protein [Circular genetic element sp.]|nr:MAG: hypothetical protein [Circular genetic element sp.]